MRTKAGLLSIVLAMVLVMTAAMTGCGAAKAPASAEGTTVSEAAGSDWYQSYLTDPATKEKYSHFALIDINQDGVPELFLSTTEDSFITDEDEACLIAFNDGKSETISQIGGQAGEIYYVNKSAGTLTCFSRLSGEGHIEVFKLENGKLTSAGKADHYSQNHGPNQTNDPLYLVNDEKVSEDDFNAFWNPNTQEDDAVTYESIQ